MSETESIAYNIKMRTQARLEKLQNELLATRKIRKQLEVDKHDDPSVKASTLFEKFRDISEAEVVNGESESNTSK